MHTGHSGGGQVMPAWPERPSIPLLLNVCLALHDGI